MLLQLKWVTLSETYETYTENKFNKTYSFERLYKSPISVGRSTCLA